MNVHVMKTCWCWPLQSVACTNPFPSLLVHRTRKAHVELTNMSLFTIVPDDLKGYDHLVPYNFSGAEASRRDKGRNQIVHCDWGGKCDGSNVWFWKGIIFLVSCSILYLSLNFHKRFLHQICTQKNDKIVLISNYTQTLDLSKSSVTTKKLLIFSLNLTYDFYKFIQC